MNESRPMSLEVRKLRDADIWEVLRQETNERINYYEQRIQKLEVLLAAALNTVDCAEIEKMRWVKQARAELKVKKKSDDSDWHI